MSQINEPNGYETEGSSALLSTANRAGKNAAKKVAKAAASKAAGSLGLPELIGIASEVLVVIAGIVIRGETFQNLERMKFQLNIYQSIKLLKKNMVSRGIYLQQNIVWKRYFRRFKLWFHQLEQLGHSNSCL